MIVVLPMAGRGTRFANKGVDVPKPIIDVAGFPMFYWALKSIQDLPVSKIIVVGLLEHEINFKISDLLKKHLAGSVAFEIVFLEDVTEGQLETVMKASELLNDEESMLIIPCDTFTVSELNTHIKQQPPQCSGVISTALMSGSQWSFVKLNSEGKVIEVAEKDRISDFACTGSYFFNSVKQFKFYAGSILAKKEKLKGEYYVISVYQKMLDDGLWIGMSMSEQMWDIGTPEAKDLFEKYVRENYS